jgi:hypothetical protein
MVSMEIHNYYIYIYIYESTTKIKKLIHVLHSHISPVGTWIDMSMFRNVCVLLQLAAPNAHIYTNNGPTSERPNTTTKVERAKNEPQPKKHHNSHRRPHQICVRLVS